MVSEPDIAKKPEDVGIDGERLQALFARAKRDVDQGLLSSVQVAVARHGKVAGMRTFGNAIQGGRRQPATDRTLYPLFSCTKGIVGVAVWALLEEKLSERSHERNRGRRAGRVAPARRARRPSGLDGYSRTKGDEVT